MSHFVGLVITTPKYDKTWEESLEKYDENLETPSHKSQDVTEKDKIRFLECYMQKAGFGESFDFRKRFVDEVLSKKEDFITQEEWEKKHNYTRDDKDERYINSMVYDNRDLYNQFFKETLPDYFARFEAMYKEYANDWGVDWKKNEETGEWEEWTTYNEDSVYDWYQQGGRWSNDLKTKSGEFVNECRLDELDWAAFRDEDYKKKKERDVFGNLQRVLKNDVIWHLNEEAVPYCVFVDGEHYTKGHMGLWCSEWDVNEDWQKDCNKLLKSLPEDSMVYLVDFHI